MQHRIRFSLRTLLVATGVLAALLGYLVHCRDVAARQSRAVIHFQELGGQARFVVRWQGPFLLAAERCDRVTGLEFPVHPIWDDDLAPLADLPDLERISLTSPGISDAAIRYLSDLDHLTSLSLPGTKVSLQGLAKLPQLSQLESLVLGKSQVVSQANVSTLLQCRRLECLALLYTEVREDDLVSLATLPNLDELALIYTGVTESVARRIERESDYRILVLHKQ